MHCATTLDFAKDWKRVHLPCPPLRLTRNASPGTVLRLPGSVVRIVRIGVNQGSGAYVMRGSINPKSYTENKTAPHRGAVLFHQTPGDYSAPPSPAGGFSDSCAPTRQRAPRLRRASSRLLPLPATFSAPYTSREATIWSLPSAISVSINR